MDSKDKEQVKAYLRARGFKTNYPDKESYQITYIGLMEFMNEYSKQCNTTLIARVKELEELANSVINRADGFGINVDDFVDELRQLQS